MSEKILVVDDEHDIADLLEVYLKNENYMVYKFYSAKEALICIEQEELDLAILDIMLPDINGFSICQKIRENHTYPIIMLTAKDEETDKITGLTLGADDYVTKPFRPLELIARVKAQLRRYKKYTPIHVEQFIVNYVLTYDKLKLNIQTYECLLDGENIALTPTEFSILRILFAVDATWVFSILPSAGIGLQNNFLYQLADFNYLHIGEMSVWTPYVILISAAIEIPMFLLLAVRSYCKHQVA
ncbi:MAG: response regulator transcription factor [Lachnospiraceae bacterium]